MEKIGAPKIIGTILVILTATVVILMGKTIITANASQKTDTQQGSQSQSSQTFLRDKYKP